VKKGEATTRATALAQRLGRDWSGDVWAVGSDWHFRVVSECSRWSVHQHKDVYSAYLNLPGELGGRVSCDGSTPEEACRATYDAALQQLREWQTMVANPPEVIPFAKGDLRVAAGPRTVCTSDPPWVQAWHGLGRPDRVTPSEPQWYARGGGVARSGPFQEERQAWEAMRRADCAPTGFPFPDDIVVWPEWEAP